MGLLLLILNLI